MLDFKRELNKLLDQETRPLPKDEFAEIALAGQRILMSLDKKQSEISMQAEEIYDAAENTAALQEAMQSEKRRADALAGAIVGLCDILEDFCAYARDGGDAALEEQARIITNNSAGLLERCGFVRLGEEGRPLDPEIHTVQSVAASPLPREHVTQVLQSGYRYLGTVVRKAVVVVSNGTEEKANEQDYRY
ncbi:MAG: nucleotide exchange factor GrpE [Clostridiales Family XIII bacterium]|jgi:molecular chaperone GrpE (heat shock protein)|nr:nucleotide exchange factor GrpE [Clostridiales Family XIII bacterium]